MHVLASGFTGAGRIHSHNGVDDCFMLSQNLRSIGSVHVVGLVAEIEAPRGHKTQAEKLDEADIILVLCCVRDRHVKRAVSFRRRRRIVADRGHLFEGFADCTNIGGCTTSCGEPGHFRLYGQTHLEQLDHIGELLEFVTRDLKGLMVRGLGDEDS